MAIHRNDDYEKLAKLIYPSIEASGNVYYGQTKKLTMDEFLGKNDFGFESHIESFTVEDKNADYGFKFINCLCWKLGPLKDEIRLDPEYGMFPLTSIYGYAKYELVMSDDKKYTDTYAGTFTTYERSISFLPYEIIPINDGKDPYGEDVYDGRNFYINSSDNVTWYLYIPIVIHNNNDEYGKDSEDEPVIPSDRPSKRGPLYIKSFGVGATIKLLAVGNFSPDDIDTLNSRSYRYSIDRENWQDLVIKSVLEDDDSTGINIDANQTVFFETPYFDVRSKEYGNQPNVNFSEERHLQFVIINDESPSGEEECGVEVGGRIDAIQPLSTPYCYYRLFKGCTNIKSAKNLRIQNINGPSRSYCREMFSGCTSLITPPEEISQTAETSHMRMFYGCTSLTRSPKLTDLAAAIGCYFEMFNGCISLEKILCNAREYEIRGTPLFPAFTVTLDYIVGPVSHGIPEVPTLDQITVYEWLKDAKQNGTLYTSGLSNPVVRRQWTNVLPTNYNITFIQHNNIDFFEDDFNWESGDQSSDQEDEFIPTYKRDYLVTSGSTSDVSYGRGDVTNKSTVTSMKTVNPLFDADAPEMDTYSSDGSFNQNVWGWKCFNGPVSFRNGIYGENASLIADTVESQFIPGESYSASSLLCKSGDKEAKVTVVSDGTSSSVILSADNIYLNGSVSLDNVARATYANNADYANRAGETRNLISLTNSTLIASDTSGNIKLNASVLPNGSYDLGSTSNKFNEIHAESFKGKADDAYHADMADEAAHADTATKSTKATQLFYNSGSQGSIDVIKLNTTLRGLISDADILPNTGSGNNYNLGADGYRWNHIYANNIHGTIDGSFEQAEKVKQTTTSADGTFDIAILSPNSTSPAYDEIKRVSESRLTWDNTNRELKINADIGDLGGIYCKEYKYKSTVSHLESSMKFEQDSVGTTNNYSKIQFTTQSVGNSSSNTTDIVYSMSPTSFVVNRKYSATPVPADSVDLGTSDYKWNTVYANRFNGVSETLTHIDVRYPANYKRNASGFINNNDCNDGAIFIANNYFNNNVQSNSTQFNSRWGCLSVKFYDVKNYTTNTDWACQLNGSYRYPYFIRFGRGDITKTSSDGYCENVNLVYYDSYDTPPKALKPLGTYTQGYDIKYINGFYEVGPRLEPYKARFFISWIRSRPVLYDGRRLPNQDYFPDETNVDYCDSSINIMNKKIILFNEVLVPLPYTVWGNVGSQKITSVDYIDYDSGQTANDHDPEVKSYEPGAYSLMLMLLNK